MIFSDLKYEPETIKINTSYPLTRFEISYNSRNRFKIEIDYMRRIPFFPTDEFRSFYHPNTNTPSKILLPWIEELFSSNCAALLSQKSPRDLFDVAMIANNSFNEITLRKALIIENMMNKNFNFSTLNITDHLKDIRLNDSLKKVLRTTKFTTKDFRNIKEKAIELLTKMQSDLTTDEKECLRIFFDEYRFDVQLLEDKNLFHPNIQHHPSILRTLQELKEKHNTFYTREGIRYELCRLANLCF